MLKKFRQGNSGTAILFNVGLALVLLFGLTLETAFGQTTENTPTANEKSAAPVAMPVLTGYKDVKIGTTAEEVREKLGKAKIDDKDGFYYEISDDEIAQIRLDKDKKVRFIAVTYSGGNGNAPKFADVFGKDATFEPSADGKIYKLVRYPQAGYWVAYSRTAGEQPSVTVSMQKMRKSK